MNRLQSELLRLYGPSPDGQDGVRALMLELARPADWEVLSAVWHGVQTELELPAPAIAVSGDDGLQLWFSLARPVDASRARDFLEQLCRRFLAAVDVRRLRLIVETPSAQARAAILPPRQAGEERWSAFVAPDLAAVFAETPWLDIAPGEEGQAALLRGLGTMAPDVFESAMQRLQAGAAAAGSGVSSVGVQDPSAVDDPRRFLLRVMNDESVPLALRIEAAKALLPGTR